MKRTWFVIAVFIAALVTPRHASAAKPPRRLGVSVSARAVEVQRAHPGGTVLLIGYEARSRDGWPVFRRLHSRGTANAGGVARFRLHEPLGERSFWVAFDLTTGAYGAADPGTRPLRELDLTGRFLKPEKNGELQTIVARVAYVYALAIRPGVGAWEITAGDGGASDRDGALDGSLAVAAGDFQKVGSTGRDIGAFRDGDVIAVFVPQEMGYLLTEVKK